jgi:hypothetical protein
MTDQQPATLMIMYVTASVHIPNVAAQFLDPGVVVRGMRDYMHGGRRSRSGARAIATPFRSYPFEFAGLWGGGSLFYIY